VLAAVAHDGIEPISEGTHERAIIDAQRFRTKLTANQPAPDASGSRIPIKPA
jgi:predicted thioesterase